MEAGDKKNHVILSGYTNQEVQGVLLSFDEKLSTRVTHEQLEEALQVAHVEQVEREQTMKGALQALEAGAVVNEAYRRTSSLAASQASQVRNDLTMRVSHLEGRLAAIVAGDSEGTAQPGGSVPSYTSYVPPVPATPTGGD